MAYRTHRPDVRIFLSIFLEFLNGCISFNIGPINTKLKNVANSHNKPTRTQPLSI